MDQKEVLSRFLEAVRSKEADSSEVFANEFTRLKRQSTKYKTEKPSKEAEKQENGKKNRYKDIVPFDHSRVKLSLITSDTDSDFINASFIKGAYGQKAYIATQGPLPNTVLDFWRMIWEYNVQVIVMACREFEMGRKKCERYWAAPEEETFKCGVFSISCESEENKGDYVVRILKATLFNECRAIYQLHYVNWPDHGVPTSIDPMLEMIWEMRSYQEHDDVPLCIHCSAGCGRTGVICAIDYTWKLLNNGIIPENFSVFDLVQEMRTQRPSLVQTKEQYELVYTSVKHLFQNHLENMGRDCKLHVTESLSTPLDISSESETTASQESNIVEPVQVYRYSDEERPEKTLNHCFDLAQEIAPLTSSAYQANTQPQSTRHSFSPVRHTDSYDPDADIRCSSAGLSEIRRRQHLSMFIHNNSWGIDQENVLSLDSDRTEDSYLSSGLTNPRDGPGGKIPVCRVKSNPFTQGYPGEECGQGMMGALWDLRQEHTSRSLNNLDQYRGVLDGLEDLSFTRPYWELAPANKEHWSEPADPSPFHPASQDHAGFCYTVEDPYFSADIIDSLDGSQDVLGGSSGNASEWGEGALDHWTKIPSYNTSSSRVLAASDNHAGEETPPPLPERTPESFVLPSQCEPASAAQLPVPIRTEEFIEVPRDNDSHTPPLRERTLKSFVLTSKESFLSPAPQPQPSTDTLRVGMSSEWCGNPQPKTFLEPEKSMSRSKSLKFRTSNLESPPPSTPPLPERTPESFVLASFLSPAPQPQPSTDTLRVGMSSEWCGNPQPKTFLEPDKSMSRSKSLKFRTSNLESPPPSTPPLPERTPESFVLASSLSPALQPQPSTDTLRVGMSSEWCGNPQPKTFLEPEKSMSRSKSLKMKCSKLVPLSVAPVPTPLSTASEWVLRGNGEQLPGANRPPDSAMVPVQPDEKSGSKLSLSGFARSKSMKFLKNVKKTKNATSAANAVESAPSNHTSSRFSLGFGSRFSKPKGPRNLPGSWV
ncbi:tyrosine-protein phosphatase non-receptor type 22-like isoform X2 [Acipenser ruthenus]|uniref:tyrosine-protein phosphatase non-receptor type 22-like isoform X2 n=1 Tax=Acipenser ruthenus TaxID=7906 RepID=UPI002741C3C9|nr:tyrosine-protein phosphatase non-receptor type 22-like isoform X2 [Acipenser ruthenus]